MPIPYMWSKRKSSHKIKNIIKQYAKEETVFVDLFAWGFAMGEVFLKDGYKVIANDLNKYVMALLHQTINKWLDEERCLKFVSRKEFTHILENKSKYEDWYVWYVMTLWSFWNNQISYLLWKDREAIYKKVYDMIVYKKVEKDIKGLLPKKYIDWILKQDDWHKRRIAFRKVWNVVHKKEFQIQSLERLQSLESLESLQSMQSLEVQSMDYREVDIPDNAIIYCDPPYSWTAEYSEWWFDSEVFREWAREKSKTHKLFVSEYNWPNDFDVVYEFSQKSSLCPTWTQSHNNQPNEKLFYMKK